MPRVVIVLDSGEVVDGWESEAIPAARKINGSVFSLRWDGDFDKAWLTALAAEERAAQRLEADG